MKNFIVYSNSNGEILRTGVCGDDDIELQVGEGESVIEGTANDATQMVADGAIVDKPPVLPPAFNLLEAQAKKLEEINLAYNRANTSTFTYLGVVYNADSIAQNNINSTANYINQFNAFPDGWLGVWLADDGSTLPMETTSDFWPFYQAYVAQGVYNITHFNQLKAQVLGLPSTATQADLDFIVW